VDGQDAERFWSVQKDDGIDEEVDVDYQKVDGFKMSAFASEVEKARQAELSRLRAEKAQQAEQARQAELSHLRAEKAQQAEQARQAELSQLRAAVLAQAAKAQRLAQENIDLRRAVSVDVLNVEMGANIFKW